MSFSFSLVFCVKAGGGGSTYVTSSSMAEVCVSVCVWKREEGSGQSRQMRIKGECERNFFLFLFSTESSKPFFASWDSLDGISKRMLSKTM